MRNTIWLSILAIVLVSSTSICAGGRGTGGSYSRNSHHSRSSLCGSSSRQSTHGPVYVKGYYRRDGTYVAPHMRSSPDGNSFNNWSTRGNVNPFTGEPGTKSPYQSLPHTYTYARGSSYSSSSGYSPSTLHVPMSGYTRVGESPQFPDTAVTTPQEDDSPASNGNLNVNMVISRPALHQPENNPVRSPSTSSNTIQADTTQTASIGPGILLAGQMSTSQAIQNGIGKADRNLDTPTTKGTPSSSIKTILSLLAAVSVAILTWVIVTEVRRNSNTISLMSINDD